VLARKRIEKIRQNLQISPKRLQDFEKRLAEGTSDTNRDTQKIVVRDSLTEEHLYGIGNLINLTVLDLSFNHLTLLPQEIANLTNLKKLDLHYNCLPRSERERIIHLFPGTQIDLTNQDAREPEPIDEDQKAVSELIQKGRSNLHHPYTKALGYFEQALDYYNKGIVTDTYRLTAIHYFKMWIYSRLAYQSPNEPADMIKKHKELCTEEAKTCLDLVPANWNIWHFTDEGQFQKEVVRYACNCIAWPLYANHDDKESLEEALQIAERGAELATESSQYYIVDTQVRILIKLGRTDEAYRIVWRILEKEPDFEDFQDFKTNPE
jgi:tetratricopeptide (TPR) repeat protein